MKELIHFAHGNGFPALCYKSVLDLLEPEFDYCYIDMIGHSKKYPVSENWHHLVDEVINSIETKADRPVIGVGHSVGGILTFIAAIERPDLFKCVVMLDSLIMGHIKSALVRLAKALGIIDRVTPAIRALGRQHYWENEEKLLHYLKQKPLFRHFQDDAIRDFIHHGLSKQDDGYYLRFSKRIEYHIYRTLPHCLSDYHGQLAVPAALIYGKQSSVVQKIDIRYTKKVFGVDTYPVAGGHMFPLEYPKETASKIIEVIHTFL